MKASHVVWNFVAMSVCFSVNHGTVTALLALASTNLGNKLAGVQSAVLYLTYTLSAVLLAINVVAKIGPKWGICSALFLFCAYVASFLLAAQVPSAAWPAAITGAAIGGTAAGWLWTSQSLFFAQSSRAYARLTQRSEATCNSYFAGLFSTIYVGLEVLMKGASSLLNMWGGNEFVYVVFTLSAAASALAMAFVRLPPLSIASDNNFQTSNNGTTTASASAIILPQNRNHNNDNDTNNSSSSNNNNNKNIKRKVVNRSGVDVARRTEGEESVAETEELEDESLELLLEDRDWKQRTMASFQMLVRDRRLQLLLGLNAAFGVASAFLDQYINGTPAKQAVGAGHVGLLAAVAPAVAAVISIPLAWYTESQPHGKLPVMVLGAASFVALAAVVAALTETQLAGMGWGIVFGYILAGVGRAVYESTNKATFADFFPLERERETAFTNIIFVSGGSAGIAFLVFPHISKLAMAVTTLTISALAIVGLLAAFRLQRKRININTSSLAVGGSGGNYTRLANTDASLREETI